MKIELFRKTVFPSEKNSILTIFTCLLLAFSSCSQQNASQLTNGNSNGKNSSIATGDTVQGLSDSIMVIYQDKKNNYWFGSRGQGVFRYDGKKIVHFTMKHGLVNNDIWGIQEDKSGNIYFDTQEGVSRFDGQSFITLQISKTIDNDLKDISPDDLWFKGNWNKNAVYRYDVRQQEIILQQLTLPKNEIAVEVEKNSPNMTWSPYGIYSHYKDKKGNAWFGTSNSGIYRYNIHDNSKTPGWMFEDHLSNVPNGGSFGIRSIFEDKDGKFWFCNTSYRYSILDEDSTAAGQHFIRYKRETGIAHMKAANGKNLIYFLSITEDINKDLWMVTYDEGVWHYNWKTMKQYPIVDDNKNITLFSIYNDNNGVLWLGTHAHGAYKFNGTSFERFKP